MEVRWTHDHWLQLLLRLVTVSACVASQRLSDQDFVSGCADGSTEGLQGSRHSQIAACDGAWSGHIENASDQCAPGWQVCGYRQEDLLKTITWKDATELSGCYAFNAAQDGGQCLPCTSHLEQDDLAGVGRGCAHQSFGQSSCITGGQIDVSCCVDTHYSQACMYRPGIATGVLCCKIPGVPPQILVRPDPLTHVQSGATFVLSCQVLGSPMPDVQWFKEEDLLPTNLTRISVFSSGYLLISGALPEDSGSYRCFASNRAGDASAEARVIVTDHASGCADGTSDGLGAYEEIHACAGTWKRHVKRAKRLCAKGWRVCSPRHAPLLTMLSWEDIMSLDGCYAYNAANQLNQCSRCFREDMAGVGKDCGRIRRSHKSCLAEGRIDVHSGRDASHGCDYVQGVTTGILCCKKQPDVTWWKPPKCRPKCINGGYCSSHNACRCPTGYKGAWCQNPICPGGCIANSECVAPATCRCKQGFTGHKCQRREHICRRPCLNGGRCRKGKCVCGHGYEGERCQHVTSSSRQADLNRTER